MKKIFFYPYKKKIGVCVAETSDVSVAEKSVRTLDK